MRNLETHTLSKAHSACSGPADAGIGNMGLELPDHLNFQEQPSMGLFNKIFQFRNFDKSFNFLKDALQDKQNILMCWTEPRSHWSVASGLHHHQLRQ